MCSLLTPVGHYAYSTSSSTRWIRLCLFLRIQSYTLLEESAREVQISCFLFTLKSPDEMIRLPPISYQFDYVDLFLNWYLMTWKQSKTNKNWQTKQRQIVLNQIFTTDLFLTVNWRYKVNALKGVENTTVVSYEKLRITAIIICKTRIFKCVCSWQLTTLASRWRQRDNRTKN